MDAFAEVPIGPDGAGFLAPLGEKFEEPFPRRFRDTAFRHKPGDKTSRRYVESWVRGGGTVRDDPDRFHRAIRRPAGHFGDFAFRSFFDRNFRDTVPQGPVDVTAAQRKRYIVVARQGLQVGPNLNATSPVASCDPCR